MQRPQYQDYLHQAKKAPHIPPKSPTANHHKPTLQHHEQTSIFLTPSPPTANSQNDSILREMKSVSRFNRSRKGSINLGSIERTSAEKSQKVLKPPQPKERKYSAMLLNNKSGSTLFDSHELQTLRKNSANGKSHTDLKYEGRRTSRQKLVPKTTYDPSKTYGKFTHQLPETHLGDISLNNKYSFKGKSEHTPNKYRPQTSYQGKQDKQSLLSPIPFRNRSRSRENSLEIKKIIDKQQKGKPSFPPSQFYQQKRSSDPSKNHTANDSNATSQTSISANYSTHSPINPHLQTKSQKMSIQDFKLGKKLGEGRFGTVFMAIHKPTGSIFALKRVPKATLKQSLMVDQFALQVRIQASFSHPNIVAIYAVFDDKEHVYLLLEYLDGGSLYGELKKRGKYEEREGAERVHSLCRAIESLHLRGVAHRDIKPQNVMMCQGQCKLGDFGWATICNELRMTYCGTTDYVSPEIIAGQQYGPSVDMWCIGVFAYELLAGKTPFYHFSRQETFKRIGEASPTFPSFFSPQAADFIDKLLKKVPQQRMCAPDSLEHPFLKHLEGA